MRSEWSHILVLAGCLAALGFGACRDRGADTTSGMTRSPATDTMAATTPAESGAVGAAATAGALSDGEIVALLDEANQADSAAGAAALAKATDPEVKAFAKLMMSEHHALRLEGQRVAREAGITAQPPANDPVKAAAEAEMKALESTPKGPQFDRTYIDREVAVHQAVIALAEQAHAATGKAELKSLIEKAKPFLEKHLEQAQALQKKLGKATA